MANSKEGGVPRRMLGRTREKVSAIGLGGHHIGKPDIGEAESIRIVRTAIDIGITFLDNSWDYNAGQSEIRMGKALRDGYRERVVPHDQDRRPEQEVGGEPARRIAEKAADRRLDLLQFHEVSRPKIQNGSLPKAAHWRRVWRPGWGQGPLYRVHRAQGPDVHQRCLAQRTSTTSASIRSRCR